MAERPMIQESAGQVEEGSAFSEPGGAVGAMSNRTVQATANATDIARIVQELSPTSQQSLGVLLSSIAKGDDATDNTRKVQELSPTSQQSLNVLISSMAKGDAYIDYDSSGKQVIEYKELKRNKFCDASQANIIAIPKSDEEVKIKIDACLELINYFKSEKSPSGVLLDETQICVSQSKQYREGEEFEPTGQVLGSGNTAGDIIIVKDKKTLKEHAMKTMLMSLFSEDEIRCWVDMIDSGYAPSLYLFKIEDNKVSMHMEILHKAVTLRSIIDEHISKVYEKDRSLLKPFSLYVLKGVLDAVSTLHQKGWAHRDLHAGNVMLQKESENSLNVKILDFGLAKRFDGPLGLDFDGFRKDIGEVVRLFSALYTGQEFDSAEDARDTWESKLDEVDLNDEDKGELFCLVGDAFKLVRPDDLKDYISLVEEHQKAAFKNAKNAILERVSAILFPDQTKDCMQNSDILTNQDAAADSGSCSIVAEETGNVISLREIIMTPSKKGKATCIKIERKKKAENQADEHHHVAGGEHTGLVINKESQGADEDLGKPHVQVGFNCFLVDQKTGKHSVENRKLKFWSVERADYLDQVTTGFSFFRELLKPENFPKDYVGFIKKCMKLMQKPEYKMARKIDLEIQPLDDAEAPRTPGVHAPPGPPPPPALPPLPLPALPLPPPMPPAKPPEASPSNLAIGT